MSSIGEGTTDPLVARFKVLEETVGKLHSENKKLKGKLQSYNTLSTFYHEARQQMRTLNQQLADKDSAIEKLKVNQTLLGSGEHQAVSLVDSLVEQLSLMKSKLKETERTCEEKVESLNQEIQRLHQQLDEKDRQAQQYSSWPQHEKEMEIFRLQKVLVEKERVQATSEVLCRSLSDESHQLRRKLASTAEMCQHLVRCLEKMQRSDHRTEEESVQMERPSKIPNLDCSNESSLTKLQEENRLLKQKVNHVEDLNAKWQKYDSSREAYVKELLLQLKEIKSRSEKKTPHSAHAHTERMQKEISRLNKLLEEKMNECVQFRKETEELTNADSERIQMLEQQLLVYKDDFISERSDRERAQSRIQELMEEISLLQHRTRKQDDRSGHKKRICTSKNLSEALRGSSSEQVEGRRQVTQADQAEGQRFTSPERRGQDELQCPHCLRIFRDQLGDNFLEHITECCQ